MAERRARSQREFCAPVGIQPTTDRLDAVHDQQWDRVTIFPTQTAFPRLWTRLPGPNAARGGHHLCFSVVINTDQVISAVRRFYPGWDPRAAHRRTTLYRSPLSGLAGLVSTLPGHDHLGLKHCVRSQGLLQDSGSPPSARSMAESSRSSRPSAQARDHSSGPKRVSATARYRPETRSSSGNWRPA
jgi:hypothetical protein